MIFIVDTNIVFSGLLKDSFTRAVLIESPFKLYAPETMVSEIRKYRELILQKAGLTRDEFETLFELLVEKIVVVEKEKYSDYLKEADKLIGGVDKKDTPFLALVLAIPNVGIWTDDKHFLKQDRIKVWSTEDILKVMQS